MVIKVVDTILIQLFFLCIRNKGFCAIQGWCRRLDENCRDLVTRTKR